MSASNITPESMEIGYIDIDTSSPGGQVWQSSLSQVTTGAGGGGVPTRGTGNRLAFQFFNGETTDSAQAQYNPIEIIGRSEPYQVYQSTGAREISLTLTFAVQGATGSGIEESLLQEVKKKCDWCRALQYPTYVSDLMYPPPVVHLGMGKRLSANGRSIRCIVTGSSVTWGAEDAPYDPTNLIPYVATVDMTFTAVFVENATSQMLDSKTILSGDF